MISFLERLLSSAKEVEIGYRETEKFFTDEKEEEIEEAREQAQELMDKTEEIIPELDKGLDDFEDYEDEKSIKAVEDVTENFYRSRKKMVEDFSPSENIEDHREDLEQFLNDFQDVSGKEAAVMDRIKKDSNKLFKEIKELEEHLEDINEFLDEEYSPVRKLENLKNLVKQIEESEDEKERLEQKKDSIDVESLKNEITKKKEEIEDLENSERWQEKEEVEQKIERLKDRREDSLKTVSKNGSRMERGLKKVLYQVRENGKEFNKSIEKLERINNGEFENVENPGPELQEASKLIADEELLGDRQLQKFTDAVKDFESFDTEMEKAEQYGRQVEKLESRLEEFEVTEEKKQVEKNMKMLKTELKESLERKDQIDEKIKIQKDKRRDLLEELEEVLNSSMKHEIEVSENQ